MYCYGDLYLLTDLQVRGNKQRLLSNIFTVEYCTWSYCAKDGTNLKFVNTTRGTTFLNFYSFRIFELWAHFLNCRVCTLGPTIRRQVVFMLDTKVLFSRSEGGNEIYFCMK